MDIGSLFQLKCETHGCENLSQFTCHKCGVFAYCSVKCRRKGHNYRRCEPKFEHILGTEKDIFDAMVEATTGESLQSKIDYVDRIYSSHMKSHQKYAAFVFDIVHYATRACPERVIDIRAFSVSGLSRNYYSWRFDVWMHIAMAYVACFKSDPTPQNIEDGILTCRFIAEKFKETKTPHNRVYTYIHMSLASFIADQLVCGKNASTKEMRSALRIAKSEAKKSNSSDLMVRVKFVEAMIARDLGEGTVEENLAKFMLEAIPLYTPEMDKSIAAPIVIDIVVAAIALGEFDTAGRMCKIAIESVDDMPVYAVRALLFLLIQIVSLTEPEEAKQVAAAVFDSIHSEEGESRLCVAASFLAVARECDDPEKAANNYRTATAIFIDIGMRFHAIECMFELFCIATLDIDITNSGKHFLTMLSMIPFTSITGFYYRNAFGIVVKHFMVEAFEERRFDNAWKFAAAFCNAERFGEVWSCPDIEAQQHYTIQMFLYKNQEKQALWPHYVESRVKAFATRRGIAMTDSSVVHYFGNVDDAHAEFVDAVGLSDDDDDVEKSFAFVWIEVDEFIYAFVVNAIGPLAIRRGPRKDGVESLIGAMTKSLQHEPEKDTVLAIVQHVGEPCKTLNQMLVGPGHVSGVWNA